LNRFSVHCEALSIAKGLFIVVVVTIPWSTLSINGQQLTVILRSFLNWSYLSNRSGQSTQLYYLSKSTFYSSTTVRCLLK